MSNPNNNYRWASRGFEDLLNSYANNPKPYDVIIIGSGYGGSIAAAELSKMTTASGKPPSICILERGNEYLPGQFPARLAELPGHVRFSTENAKTAVHGQQHGLFDIRFGSNVNTVLANGLGGGSLINAGVMAQPKDKVFAGKNWPVKIRDNTSNLHPLFEEARLLLGAGSSEKPNAYPLNSTVTPDKLAALQAMSRKARLRSKKHDFKAAPITVALQEGKLNSAGIALNKCLQCGDCATGCNYGAKDSLDSNLLAAAAAKGAEIYTGATVLKITPVNGGAQWDVEATFTNPKLRKREGKTQKIRCNRLIVAAGTYGSTELLLKSNSTADGNLFAAPKTPADSTATEPQGTLGGNFSTNGDMIAVGYGENRRVNAIANESQPPGSRKVGPTITGMISTPRKNPRFLIEELAVPGPLRRVFEEMTTTLNVVRQMDKLDKSTHVDGHPHPDPFSTNAAALKNTSIYAVMGDDDADGTLELNNKVTDSDTDSAIRVNWKNLHSKQLFEDQLATLEKFAAKKRVGGKIIPNPLYQLLPKSSQFLLENGPDSEASGSLLTVHPLGGCPMADSRNTGVVNHLGQVFKSGGNTTDVYDNLLVLDGSIVPTALSANPALTIATLSLRAIRKLTAANAIWQFNEVGERAPAQALVKIEPGMARPVFRDVKAEYTKTPNLFSEQPTEFEYTEQLAGEAELTDRHGNPQRVAIELTLRYEQQPLSVLTDSARQGGRKLIVASEPGDEPLSQMRVIAWEDWKDTEDKQYDGWETIQNSDLSDIERAEKIRTATIYRCAYRGDLKVFHREGNGKAGKWRKRLKRGATDWWHNRGKRDVLGNFISNDSSREERPNLPTRILKILKALIGFPKQAREVIGLATHAAEIRLLEYELTLGRSLPLEAGVPGRIRLNSRNFQSARVHGLKRFTYNRRGNIFTQLSDLTLHKFPELSATQKQQPPILTIDFRFMVKRGTPLFRIAEQKDQPTALVDLISFSAYLIRMAISIHVWSFRKPENPEPEGISYYPERRFPGMLPGVGTPEETFLPVDIYTDYKNNEQLAKVKLSRYSKADSTLPPVLMIHGYSTSGSTFAHPLVDPNLATTLWHAGHEVWVLDMRSSIAFPSATHDWTFENMAYFDIPLAVAYVYKTVNEARGGDETKVDIVAHCMGGAMFSMAVTTAAVDFDGEYQPWGNESSWDVPNDSELDEASKQLIRDRGEEVYNLFADRFADPKYDNARTALPSRINSVVLSQVGPVVIPTPINVFRGYIARYMQALVVNAGYSFRPGEISLGNSTDGNEPGRAAIIYDRLIHSLRYPKADYDREIPYSLKTKASFVGTRHRMDALYGRTFELDKMDDQRLELIDELYGPLNLKTLTQATHFAEFFTVTESNGRNFSISLENINAHWRFPTLYLHGKHNGMMHYSTLDRMNNVFKQSGKTVQPSSELNNADKSEKNFYYHPLNNNGHQDSIIGINAGDEAFPPTVEFLSSGVIRDKNKDKDKDKDMNVGPFSTLGPDTGPFIGRSGSQRGTDEQPGIPVGLGPSPNLTAPKFVVFIAMQKGKSGLRLPGNKKSLTELAKADNYAHALLVTTPVNPVRDWLATELPLSLVNAVNNSDNINRVLCAMVYDKSSVFQRRGTGQSGDKDDVRTPSLEHADIAKLMADEKLWNALDTSVTNLLNSDSAHSKIQITHGLLEIASSISLSEPKHLKFALGSCQYTRGILDKLPANGSFRSLDKRINKGRGNAPQFMLLAGDLIYSDATAGLYDPGNTDDRHNAPYRQLFRDSAVRSVLRKLPAFTMLDDHELINNWEPVPDDSHNESMLTDGLAAYLKYQRGGESEMELKVVPGTKGKSFLPPEKLWYKFTRSGVPFFVADSRSQRPHRNVLCSGNKGSILGDKGQLEALLTWLLAQPNHLPKFVLSPAIVLPRHNYVLRAGNDENTHYDEISALVSDKWDGFPGALTKLLTFIADNGIQNVVFLSGDEHLSCLTHAMLTPSDPAKPPVSLHSIHTSALYAPYPFASAMPEYMITDDDFQLTTGAGSTRCVVHNEIIDGSGFTLIELTDNLDVVCEFDRPEMDNGKTRRVVLTENAWEDA